LAKAIEINRKQVALFYARPNPISEVEVGGVEADTIWELSCKEIRIITTNPYNDKITN